MNGNTGVGFKNGVGRSSNNGGGSSSNGTGGSSSLFESLTWKMGLMNEAGKFLTAEPFGFKLNVSASTMKKRQIWIVVPDPDQAEHVYLKSHLNRYLAADKDGRVTCDAEELDREAKFQLDFSKNTSEGGWSFKSVEYGYYLTGNEDHIHCFAKSPTWWRPHLAIHPQVHLRNLNRQRYVRLQGEAIHGDQIIPWGYDSLITLAHYNGKVAVRTRDNRFLQNDGTLAAQHSAESLYNLEIRAGQHSGLALQDASGRYLTLIGSTGTMKVKNKTVGKDELFVLENSFAQIAILAHNDKYASVRQGVDVYANQSEVQETETFQLEYQSHKGLWRIRCSTGKFWSIDASTGGIKATGNENDANSYFQMEYQSDASVVLRAANQQYVTSRKLGVVSATSDKVSTEEKFNLVLLNRPIMVFQSEFGLLGVRNSRVECNMVNYEAFQLDYIKDGQYTIKDGKSCYWHIGEGNALLLAPRASASYCFTFEFVNGTQMCIRADNGKYLRGEQNGCIKADSEQPFLWEY